MYGVRLRDIVVVVDRLFQQPQSWRREEEVRKVHFHSKFFVWRHEFPPELFDRLSKLFLILKLLFQYVKSNRLKEKPESNN